MKKIKLALIGIVLMIGSIPLMSQISMDEEAVSIWTLGVDTMYITRGDQIAHLSIYVPAEATDSAVVTGKYMVLGGIASNGVTLAPGEVSLNLGQGYSFLDSVTIVSRNKTIVTALPKLPD